MMNKHHTVRSVKTKNIKIDQLVFNFYTRSWGKAKNNGTTDNINFNPMNFQIESGLMGRKKIQNKKIASRKRNAAVLKFYPPQF